LQSRICDEPTGHAFEQEHAHGGDGNAGIAAKCRGTDRGIKGIWTCKGLSPSLN